MGDTDDDALYRPLGDGRYRAGPLTQGPWHPRRQHGGPVAALLAHAVEAHAVERLAGDGWTVPQLTVDYLRPVPIGELTVVTETIRRGRRACSLLTTMTCDDVAVARARAWLVAPGSSEPAGAAAPPPPLPPESSYGRARFAFGFQRAVELRFVTGSLRERGPATAWALLRVPVVPGAAPSPLERTAAVADFATGISAEVDRSTHSYANLDLTLHLHRAPAGDWLCMSAATVIGPAGTGLCDTTLHDRTTAVGRCAQTLFIAPTS